MISETWTGKVKPFRVTVDVETVSPRLAEQVMPVAALIVASFPEISATCAVPAGHLRQENIVDDVDDPVGVFNVSLDIPGVVDYLAALVQLYGQGVAVLGHQLFVPGDLGGSESSVGQVVG